MFKNIKKESKISYSQCGEDLIVDFIFQAMGIGSPTYLDLGAHHPFYINNTFYFYDRGCCGVCVEPDPTLFAYIKKSRKKDICLNVGVGVGAKENAKFYVLSARTLNTFSKSEAERYQSYGNHKIEKILNIPLVKVDEIIREHFSKGPNFVSLDVEGLDFEIIKTYDFSYHRPEVFCIETLTYTEDKSEKKLTELIDYMKGKDYMVYADTYINTIFVNRESWEGR